MRTFQVKYHPYHADSAKIGSFHLQSHTNKVLLDADSITDAKKRFYEGNNGEIVSVVSCVEIKNPTKPWGK